MWPRVVELLLGSWLLASPAVVGHGAGGPWVPWISGAVILALAGSTFVSFRYRMSYIGQLPVAAFLIFWGWSQAPRPGPAWAQSFIVIGLILGLTAILPTQVTRPPGGWRPHVNEEN